MSASEYTINEIMRLQIQGDYLLPVKGVIGISTTLWLNLEYSFGVGDHILFDKKILIFMIRDEISNDFKEAILTFHDNLH